MDSLTQIILGVAVAHVGLRGKENWKKTIALGALLGTLPDLDVYVSKILQDPLAEIELHRGFSHSILFFLLLSLVLTPLIKRFFKETSSVRLLITVFFILLTHSLLDVFTTWGTQILWPLHTKFALKSIFVVDITYTIPLLMGVLLGLKNKRITFTYAGLFISTLYLFWGLIAQTIVKNRVVEHFKLAYDKPIVNSTVKPTFSNSFLWNVIIQTNDGFYLSDRTLFEDDQMEFTYFSQNKNLINGINDENIDRLIAISENQYVISQNEKGLVFNDLRFGLLKKDEADVQFAFSYQLVPTNKRYQVVEMPKDRKDGMKLLKNIWFRITGL